MSKRLQITLSDREYREIQRLARLQGLSLAEWLRHALRVAYQSVPADVAEKLAAVRRATRLEYPTADIDRMLTEIRQDS